MTRSINSRSAALFWVGAFTLANIGTKGAGVLAVMLLGSVLSPTDYASFGIVYALQSGIAMLAVTGLVEAAVGRLGIFAAGKRRRSLFVRTSGFFRVTSALSLLILSPFVIGALHNAPAIATVAGVALGLVSGYAVLQASLLRIEYHNAQSLLLSAGVPLCATLGLVAGASADLGLGGIFALSAASGVAAFAAVGLAGGGYPSRRPRRRQLRQELPLMAPYFAINLLGWLTGYGMNFVVAALFGSGDVAAYTFLFTVASIGQLVANSMNMVFAPRFYEAFNNAGPAAAEQISRASFRLLAIALGAIGFVTVAALPWVTAELGGNLATYGRDRLAIALLIGGYILCIPWWHGQNYYHVASEGRRLMTLSIVSGLATLGAWIGAMLLMGAVGIYAGFALQLAIRSLWMLKRARRRWPLRPPWAAIFVGVALTLSALLLPAPLAGLDR